MKNTELLLLMSNVLSMLIGDLIIKIYSMLALLSFIIILFALKLYRPVCLLSIFLVKVTF